MARTLSYLLMASLLNATPVSASQPPKPASAAENVVYSDAKIDELVGKLLSELNEELEAGGIPVIHYNALLNEYTNLLCTPESCNYGEILRFSEAFWGKAPQLNLHHGEANDWYILEGSDPAKCPVEKIPNCIWIGRDIQRYNELERQLGTYLAQRFPNPPVAEKDFYMAVRSFLEENRDIPKINPPVPKLSSWTFHLYAKLGNQYYPMYVRPYEISPPKQ